MDYWEAHALLEWQVELGVSEAIGETPVNRYEIPKEAPKPAAAPVSSQPPTPVKAPEIDATDEAQKAVASCVSIEDIKTALLGFEHCDLRRGARNLVFQDGSLGARVMVVGDAPSREDDIEGKPFMGPAGALFDKMFDAIGLSRTATNPAQALYITKALPWRPPENRDPTAREIAMLKPFLLRHIELANPDFIVLMGNPACAATLGRTGITRLRGNWQTVLGKPALPMMSPRDILRTPLAKRDAWADLLDLQARLRKVDTAPHS
ncbi:DNA polymerase [Pacificibacter maritimus]|uniref:Type-4 uracil-DNA glycosylase n=1 Tax=Pacificibacter maritimus TaxID=762213 RepID=A0A3N4UCW0_9RHOB|nr:DNA polymerase [Pacificibacter maritimus]